MDQKSPLSLWCFDFNPNFDGPHMPNVSANNSALVLSMGGTRLKQLMSSDASNATGNGLNALHTIQMV